MPKLHLKRTAQEEAEHRIRKRLRRERREHKKNSQSSTATTDKPQCKWGSSDSEGELYGPHPATEPDSGPGPSTFAEDSRHKPDYDAIRAEVEEARFREKMASAFDDDDRLDSLESRMNDYAHVPGRWRQAGASRSRISHPIDDDIASLDPNLMDDEEYAEWIRAGMYRKSHAQELAEQQQRQAAIDARCAHEKAMKAESDRLEKIEAAERQRAQFERERRRTRRAQEEYELRWNTLVSSAKALTFEDIPWPVNSRLELSDDNPLDKLTVEAIQTFLLSSLDQEQKMRKERLRETFLRFHPDKFEGRYMNRIRESDQELVRQGIGEVVRALTMLMSG
ncbi:unnamed protein product [Mycena citricolor]|uniref:Uncharacterized protein n=1 Tax=Mycena citricolor TaxID=2018698 RepID=A0AAD2HUI0_9AGAR|nr:unnamed protein product [Mycena citricolor]